MLVQIVDERFGVGSVDNPNTRPGVGQGPLANIDQSLGDLALGRVHRVPFQEGVVAVARTG
jgi:hypothetical protein